MNEINENFGLGWVRDLPDFRDYSPENEKIRAGPNCLNRHYQFISEYLSFY